MIVHVLSNYLQIRTLSLVYSARLVMVKVNIVGNGDIMDLEMEWIYVN